MTLDRLINLTVKGHFCSLLISNIFCYPHFRNLPSIASLKPHSASKIVLSGEPRLFFCAGAM